MKSNFVINSLFELGGAVMMWINVRTLYKDKAIKGVFWPVWAFYCAWGLWNLFYYPSVGDMFSFASGIALVTGNIVWLILAFKYRNNNEKIF